LSASYPVSVSLVTAMIRQTGVRENLGLIYDNRLGREGDGSEPSARVGSGGNPNFWKIVADGVR
jgi:hypothetical protein